MSTTSSSVETGPDLGVDDTPQPDDQPATAQARRSASQGDLATETQGTGLSPDACSPRGRPR